MRKSLVVFAVIILVVAVCAIDIHCSTLRDKGRPTEISRIRGELEAGRAQEKMTREEGIAVQIRMLRARVRKLKKEGKTAEARQVTNEIIRLTNLLEAMRSSDN